MTVKEEVPVDTIVGTLEAIDEDIGDNAAVDYAITCKDTKTTTKAKKIQTYCANVRNDFQLATRWSSSN